MADIILRTAALSQVTSVSNIFIDEYMPEAKGDHVKVYLYLLMHLNDQRFSISDIMQDLSMSQKEICSALKYWDKQGLLRLEYASARRLGGICMLTPVSRKADYLDLEFDADASEAVAATEPLAASEPAVKAPSAPAASDGSDDSFRELLCLAQHYLKRQLNLTETNTILYWYEELAFSPELIEYVIEYSIERGHTSIHYMNSVALAWAKDGISTVSEAKQAGDTHSSTVRAVEKAMGITGRNLVEDELRLIDKWTGEYGFTIDIIDEACRRTIAQTGKGSFAYADKILSSWHDRNVHHIADIATVDSEHKQKSAKAPASRRDKANGFHNFDQRDMDYDKMEELLLAGQ